MSRRLSFLLTGILFICFALPWSGCNENEDTNPVNVDLKKKGNIQFSLSKTTLNDEITKVTTILTRTGYEAIKKDLFINGHVASGNIKEVAKGVWQLLVEAKDTNDSVLYDGKANVEVIGEKVTYVNINLSEVSSQGELAISVTWNQGKGINWTKHSSNPVLIAGPAGSWDSGYVETPSVLFDGTEYKMWFAGTKGVEMQIGLATSSDGINWIKYSGNPVLDIGKPGDWDGLYVYSPEVIYNGKEYIMWFCGGAEGTSRHIGYAISSDGINWSKYSGNPVLTMGSKGSWDDEFLLAPKIIYDGESYKMWYSGCDGSTRQIGYATSLDGIHWTKYSGNPVMTTTAGAWDSSLISGGVVLHDGQEYKMWYNGSDGTNYRIGYATSSDGINWVKYSDNPILNIGSAGSWDDVHVFYPAIANDGKSYKMWFTGWNGSTRKIGYATSP